jgi:phosphate:Na+ symporter
MSLGYNVDLTAVVFPAFLVGMVLIYKKRHRVAGDFLFGIAFLFWSLVMLSSVGRDMDLAHNPDVVNFFASFDTGSYLTILAFLAAGTLITCVVQSSAAVMAITILLCSTGVLPIYMGIALVMGENIGTTATANLAALGAGTEARRAALAHLLFNVFGVVWVLAVFYPLVDMVCSLVGYNPSLSGQAERIPVVLAMFHTCFNVLNTALLIGFIPQMERIVCRLLPEGKVEAKQPTTLHFISGGVIQTPEIAVLQAQKEIVHFAERMHRMFGMVCSLIDEKDKKEFESQYARIERYETIADNMEIEIANFLEQVGNEHLSDETKEKTRVILRQIGELESIGDACYKMARTVNHLRENKEDFTAEQYTRLHDMLRLVNEAVVQMIVVVSGRRKDLSLADSLSIENDINELRNILRSDSAMGVDAHLYSYAIGTIYNDIVADCEKIGDYVMNIVEARLGKHLLSYNGLSLNLDKKEATVDGNPVNLTRTEFELLHLLLLNRGKVLSRQELMDTVWAGVIVTDRTVNVNITRLRKKLGPYAQNIASRTGYGYVFEE